MIKLLIQLIIIMTLISGCNSSGPNGLPKIPEANHPNLMQTAEAYRTYLDKRFYDKSVHNLYWSMVKPVWKQVTLKDTEEAYQQYLDIFDHRFHTEHFMNNPETLKYALIAKKRMEEIAWKQAKNNNTYAGYSQFIEKYNGGKYYLNAFELMESFHWTTTDTGCKVRNPSPSIKYEENFVWTGECHLGKIHGKGSLTWYVDNKKDKVLRGKFSYGILNGFGMGISIGNKGYEGYEGDYRNSERNGTGRYIWEDGTVYIGEFKEHTMNGLGKIIWANGKIYEGKWAWGKPTYRIPDDNGFARIAAMEDKFKQLDNKRKQSSSSTAIRHRPSNPVNDITDWLKENPLFVAGAALVGGIYYLKKQMDKTSSYKSTYSSNTSSAASQQIEGEPKLVMESEVSTNSKSGFGGVSYFKLENKLKFNPVQQRSEITYFFKCGNKKYYYLYCDSKSTACRAPSILSSYSVDNKSTAREVAEHFCR